MEIYIDDILVKSRHGKDHINKSEERLRNFAQLLAEAKSIKVCLWGFCRKVLGLPSVPKRDRGRPQSN